VTIPAALLALPDEALVPVRWVKEQLADSPEERFPERLVTTIQLSERFGMSPEWWRDRAPKIPGARQESPGSPWYLPWVEAKRFFEDYWRKPESRGTIRRGPRKAAP
jgi:hypothetical protein